MNHRWTMTVALTALVVPACAGDRESAGWAGQVDTLPNGALHVRNPAFGIWDSADAWTLEEDLRIGRVEGEGPDLFSSQLLLAVDSAGRILVLDRQAHEVRVFDPDGAHVRTFGREGEGPGEFRQPNGLRVDAQGRVWVVDPGAARYSVFDGDGRFITSHRRNVRSFGFIFAGELAEDGTIIEQDIVRHGEGSRVIYVRMRGDAPTGDTLYPPALAAPAVWEISGPQFRSMTAVPFSAGPHYLADRTGHVWFGRSDNYRLTRIGPTGDTVLIVERTHERLPVTPAERTREVDRVLAGLPSGANVDMSLVPAQKPVFRDAQLDAAGNLWVRLVTHDDTTGTTFDIFDSGGRYLGAVRSPAALALWPAPVFTPDALYGVVRDEFDVPYVVRMRLSRGGRSGGS